MKPLFERSFANHPKVKYWSKINNCNPEDIYQGSKIKFWFDCDICNHSFEKCLYDVKKGGWCPYCSSKLCSDINCTFCLNKSFKSIEKSKYIVDTGIDPRFITKNSAQKLNFKCEKCNHIFISRAKSVSEGYWCPYCYHSLCDDLNCNYCFNKSFASNPKSKYWSSKNTINPRQVRQFSKTKIIFNCDECNIEFQMDLNTVSKNHWCPTCKYKTEKKLLKWLIEQYKDINYQPKYSWCKSLKCSKLLVFDYEYKNIIIELDGEQHYRQVGNWKSPEENIKRDKYKMKCALENGKHIIRICQNTVFKNKNNWDLRLKKDIDELLEINVPQIRYINIDPIYFN
jgi:hypothetical protein